MLRRTWSAVIAALLLLVPLTPPSALASGELQIWSVAGLTQDSIYLEGPTYDPALDAISLYPNVPMDLATLPTAVQVTANGAPVPYTVTSQDKQVTLHMGARFAERTTYQLTIQGGTNGLMGAAGEVLPASRTYTFVTGTATESASVTWDGPGVTRKPLVTGATVSREMTALYLTLSRPLQPAGLRDLITIEDPDGNPAAEWQFRWYDSPPNTVGLIEFFTPSWSHGQSIPLVRNATYTIRFKGGPAGVKLLSGETLPADFTYTIQTDDSFAPRTVQQVSPWDRTNWPQTELYPFHAEAGPLTLWTPQAGSSIASVLDTTGKVIASTALVGQGEVTKRINLPTAGDYVLMIAPGVHGALKVTGLELQMQVGTPLVSLATLKPFTTQNGTFAVTPTVRDDGSTSELALMLGNQILWQHAFDIPPHETAPDANLTFGPVSVETATLADGLYHLTLMGQGRGNENLALVTKQVLVDRTSTFADTASSWARPWIEAMATLQIVSGRGDGRFYPTAAVSRAEFAKLLAVTQNLKPAATPKLIFADMPDDWSKPYLQALADQGLLVGETVGGKHYSNATRPITRQEASVILGRLLGVDKLDVTGAAAPVTDWTQVPTWARSSVYALKQIGMVSGRPDGSFGPAASLRRDETVKLLGYLRGLL